SATVLVAWLFWHTFRVHLPSLIETFHREAREQREAFRVTLEEIEEGFVQRISDMFIAELRQQRTDFQAEQAKVREDFREELSKQRHSLMNIITSLNLEKQLMLQQMHDMGIEPKIRRPAAPDLEA